MNNRLQQDGGGEGLLLMVLVMTIIIAGAVMAARCFDTPNVGERIEAR